MFVKMSHGSKGVVQIFPAAVGGGCKDLSHGSKGVVKICHTAFVKMSHGNKGVVQILRTATPGLTVTCSAFVQGSSDHSRNLRYKAQEKAPPGVGTAALRKTA